MVWYKKQMSAVEKKRLDLLIQEQHPEWSRTQIQSWIMQGKVIINGKIYSKPGVQVQTDVQVNLDVKEPRYVSRAGFKLEKALEHFKINVHGLTVVDAGLSTGGFTDCLIQKGIKLVYGVDVGYGQAHELLRRKTTIHANQV